MDYIKVNENEIKVIETKSEVIEKVYNLKFLLEQRENIQLQKNRDNVARDRELAEVNTLIEECGKLGIVEKVKEIIK